jgi:retron-type reverse transcriptase
MALIEQKIKDRKFTKLIWKSLKGGHFEFGSYKYNIIGTPQGSIISPILANIFLCQLDNFVLALKKDFDKGNDSREDKNHGKLRLKIQQAKSKGDMVQVIALAKQAKLLPYTNHSDPRLKRLCYVRYADDWMVGIKGSKSETEEILNKIKEFLSTLDLSLNVSKTKITNVSTDKANFLGTRIYRARHVKYVRMARTSAIKRNRLKLRLDAPILDLVKKLKEVGFMKQGKSYPRFIWMY